MVIRVVSLVVLGFFFMRPKIQINELEAWISIELRYQYLILRV